MKYGWFVFFLLLPSLAQAQLPQGHIRALYHFTGDSLLLRWNADNSRLWQTANKYGYVIDRYTVENGKRSQAPVRLTPTPLKPLPLKNWEALAQKIDRAAIVAQMLYGDSFKPETGAGKIPLSRFEEQQQRFGFTALIADQYYAVALAAGLGFTDRKIRTGEVYIYRIFSPVPASERVSSDTAWVYASRKSEEPAGVPGRLEAFFGDRLANLSWSGQGQPFSGYFVERSRDNVHFTSLTKEPIVNFQSDDAPVKNDQITYRDSLPANGVRWYYRVRGLTAFGELTAPTRVAQGMGIPKLTDVPVITLAGKRRADGHILVNWAFPELHNQNLVFFELRRSTVLQKGGIRPDSLRKRVPASIREWVDEHPLPLAYYQVVAVTRSGQVLESSPSLVEIPDQIPPAKPLGLIGRIDTTGQGAPKKTAPRTGKAIRAASKEAETGLVRLSWQPNQEPDLLGYRVFRSELATGPFIQVTTSLSTKASFVDTINIDIAPYVYYKLVAIDHRANPSPFSETLKIKRPDRIPPVAPAFGQCDAQVEVIHLRWFNSPSNDLDSTYLYRQDPGKTTWKLLAAFSGNTVGFFADTTGSAAPGAAPVTYSYTLRAKDQSGLWSSYRQPIALNWIPAAAPKPSAIALTPEKSGIRATWTSLPGVRKTIVYRKVGQEPYVLYRTLWKEESALSDTYVRKGSRYTYRIRMVFEDGKESRFSPPASLTLE